MKLWQLILLGVILVFVVGTIEASAYAYTAEIRAVDGNPVYSKNVTLNGWSGAGNLTYWFEYGRLTGMDPYPFKTDNLTGGGNFSIRLEGLPLITDKTYYARCCNDTACSYTEISWTMSAPVVPVPTYYGAAYDTLTTGRKLNITNMPFVATSPYTGIMGSQITWGLIFAFIFLGYWFMTENVELPVILGLITSGSLLYAGTLSLGIPPEFITIAQAMMIVSVIGLIYTLLRRR